MTICKSSTSQSRSRLIETFRDFSRLFETFVIICNFCGFVDIFLDLNQEIMDFYKYLDRDFSSQLFLFTFRGSILASIWAKSVGHSNFFSKNLDKNLDYLKKSWLSKFISMVSISLDNLDKNLDTAKS